MIQISFRTQDPNNPKFASKFTTDPWSTLFLKSTNLIKVDFAQESKKYV